MEENKAQNNSDENIFIASQEMGLKAANFIKEKNYISAKILLIQACENLTKLIKISPNSLQAKQLFNQLIVQAEECQKTLKEIYKINVNIITR